MAGHKRMPLGVLLTILILVVPGRAAEIHDAIDSGDLGLIRTVLAASPDAVNAADAEGKTPLHLAIAAGRVDLAEYLLDNGADVDVSDKTNESPLHVAAYLGNANILERLLGKSAATINDAGFRQMTPLHYACDRGHVEAVGTLLAGGADTESKDVIGTTALIFALGSHNLEIVKMMVAAGADINYTVAHRGRTYTPMVMAAMYGFSDGADYLLTQGAVIPDETLEYVCRAAIGNNMPGLFDYVQTHGVDIEELKEHDPNLIISAVAGGSAEIVRTLLKSGFTLDRTDADGWTPLHYAAEANQAGMIDFLVARDLDINARTARGRTAYTIACDMGHAKMVDHLIAVGADTSAPALPALTGSYMGQTPPGDEPELFMPGIVSGHYRAHTSIVFTPDGREAYWSEMSYGEGGVVCMKMIGDTWTAPAVTNICRDPSITPDGQRMYFIEVEPLKAGERPAGGERDGNEKLWYMDRTDDGWSQPVRLGEAVNCIPMHWQSSSDLAGNLYFSEFADSMYCCRFVDGDFQKAVNLRTLFDNETLVGTSPFISPQGDYLLFSAMGKLVVSFKTAGGAWADAVDLGDKINIGGQCGSPRVTADGRHIFFVGFGGGRQWGIYWASAEIIETLRRRQSGDR